MMESGLEHIGMDLVHKDGKMDLYILGIGNIIKLMVQGSLFILMVTSMKVIGSIIKLVDMGFLSR